MPSTAVFAPNWSNGQLFRSKCTEISFTVQQSEKPGIFDVRFQIGGEEIQGQLKTRLASAAVKRARSAIGLRLSLDGSRADLSVATTKRCSSPPFRALRN